MKFKTIVFTYTGLIGKNYGVDGSALVKEGVEYTPDNIKDENIAKVWVREGFAEYKTGEAKKEVKKPEVKHEDVAKVELEKEEVTTQEEIEEIQLKVEEEKPKTKKTWSTCKEIINHVL